MGNSDGSRKSFDRDSFSQQADVLNIVLDHINQGMVVIGQDYRTLAFNKHFEDIFQLPPDTVEIGVDFRKILRIWAKVTGQDKQMLDRAIYQLDEPSTFEFEFSQLIKGELQWCLLTHNPLPNKGCVRTYTDITRRKQTEDRLRESEERFRVATDSFNGILWVIDTHLRFTISKGQALSALGLKPGQVVGMNLYDFFQTTDPNHPSIAPHLRALRGEVAEYEYEHHGRLIRTFFHP